MVYEAMLKSTEIIFQQEMMMEWLPERLLQTEEFILSKSVD